MAGVVAAVAGDAHAVALGRALLGQPGRDAPLVRLGHALDQCPVDLAGGAATERLGQLLGGKARARHHQNAGGIAVEPVDEARLLALAVAEGLQHAIDVAGEAGPALHRQTRRFVEDEDLIVLMQDHGAQRIAVVRQLGRRLRRRLRRRDPAYRHRASLPARPDRCQPAAERAPPGRAPAGCWSSPGRHRRAPGRSAAASAGGRRQGPGSAS